ncbi:alkaline phosphatase family protein, partial [Candidatus Woesearchaeota archaeon]|nr:alkaline phosphatase family protein [Candidatus Woesearchaeota archaeon]
FMFALWSEHDYMLHDYRSKSKKVLDNLKMFDRLLKEFVSSIKGTDTIVIVTADHGMIDIPDKKMIWIEDHPKLKECLKWTMNGQQRYCYCHVKKGKEKRFVDYVKMNLQCKIFTCKEIIDLKLFGLFEYHKDIMNRLGDYILIPDDDYAFYDLAPGEERSSYGLNYGDHGGLSSDEMFVPLIVIKA